MQPLTEVRAVSNVTQPSVTQPTDVKSPLTSQDLQALNTASNQLKASTTIIGLENQKMKMAQWKLKVAIQKAYAAIQTVGSILEKIRLIQPFPEKLKTPVDELQLRIESLKGKIGQIEKESGIVLATS